MAIDYKLIFAGDSVSTLLLQRFLFRASFCKLREVCFLHHNHCNEKMLAIVAFDGNNIYCLPSGFFEQRQRFLDLLSCSH